MKHRTFDYTHSTAFIIAAMIGTGVFTSLGLQVQTIPSVSAVLLLWVLGGVFSLCGALAYAELGAAHPRSGGEYHLLTTIYTPTLGFIAGVATLIAGLAAPLALSSVAFSKYMHNVLPLPQPIFTVGIILFTTLIHSLHVRFGALFHSAVTYFNLALILMFIGTALFFVPLPAPNLMFTRSDAAWILTPEYAVAFVFVSYSYLGWNTSVYVIDEIHDVQKTLPRSIITGVLAVTVLYVLLNYAFLKVAPIQELAGKIDVGYVAAQYIFGEQGAVLMSGLIALSLFASVSSYTVLGPRVWRVMGEDYGHNIGLLQFASQLGSNNTPFRAFWLQAALSVIIVLTSTFEAILVYTGFLLTIFNVLAVVGVMILRRRHPEFVRPYKVWGYPITPVIFALISAWMCGYGLLQRPTESAFVLATFVVGVALSWWNNRTK